MTESRSGRWTLVAAFAVPLLLLASLPAVAAQPGAAASGSASPVVATPDASETPTATPAPTPAPSVTPEPPPAPGLIFTTPYPAVEVDPGGSVTFALHVETVKPERVGLAVSSVPDGFTTTMRGGGFIVDAVQTLGETPPSGATEPVLSLEVDTPATVAPGNYQVVVQATGSEGVTSLTLDLAINAAAAGSVTMTTTVPNQKGDSSKSFTFNLTLSNKTAQEITFTLSATGPSDWAVSAILASQAQAATAVVAAGDTANITVSATPADGAAANTYPIHVDASGGSYDATTDLTVEITGSYGITLATSDGNLQTNVTAGADSALPFIVTNTGTAPLTNVSLTASGQPTGWNVTYDTDTVPSIAAGDQTTITAHIVPSGDAVAGDYNISFTAKATEKSSTPATVIRTTVETSPLLGIVGIALIVLIFIGLLLVFRRYGRR